MGIGVVYRFEPLGSDEWYDAAVACWKRSAEMLDGLEEHEAGILLGDVPAGESEEELAGRFRTAAGAVRVAGVGLGMLRKSETEGKGGPLAHELRQELAGLLGDAALVVRECAECALDWVNFEGMDAEREWEEFLSKAEG